MFFIVPFLRILGHRPQASSEIHMGVDQMKMIGSFRKNTSVDVRLSGGKEKAISIFFQE
jgi:hypothetical protein